MPWPDDDKIEGMAEKGNLDPFNREAVYNPDGSISTMRTMGVGNAKGQEVLIPSVADGRWMSPMETIQRYKTTGENFGKFKDVQSADAYDKEMHQRMAADANLKEFGPNEQINFDQLLEFLKGQR